MYFQIHVWQLMRLLGKGNCDPENGKLIPVQGHFFQGEIKIFKRDFICLKLKLFERQELHLQAIL